MPSWLVEDPTVVYLLLAVGAIALVAAAYRARKRKRWYVLAAAALVGLMGVVWLLDYLIVTDREQILLACRDLAQAAARRDMDRTFSFISKDFRNGNLDKAELRRRADAAIQHWGVRDIKLWEFHVDEVSRPARSAKVSFLAKASGNWGGGAEFYRVVADLVLEPDGQWRMRGFQLFNPFVETNQPMPVPF